MKLKPFLLSLLALIINLNAQVTLPYYMDFEGQEGFMDEDPLSNSNDWTTTDTSIVTADDVAQSGTQSVRITSASPENIISLAFDPSGNSILFVDYYMQLTASALPGLPSFTQPETTAIIAVQPYLANSGKWVFLDGDGAGSGTWVTVGETMPLDGSNCTGWHRITLRFDLTSSLWDVYIDDNLLAVNLGFVEALVAGSEAINIYGNSVGVAYLDTFSLATTNPLFTDMDLDGIPDAFESSNGLNPTIDDRDLDPDSDGLTNIEEYAYETNPSVFNADEGALNEILYNRTNWYIDAVNGDDATGNGSQAFPLQSLSALLAINTANPDYVGTGDTVYLAAGNYGTSSDVIAIDGLSLEGTLDINGESLTQISNLEIIADNVTVKNLDFNNTSLELKNVSGALITNNQFTGSVGVSLSLLGSSNNTIDHNRFESAQYHSVMLSWDAATGTASNDNQFIRNYFTHRTSAATNESVYCIYSVGNNNSLNARNRFIGCAFEEMVSGSLTRVITDEGTWWMTDTASHPYQYSVRFEDCYFKRADRFAPFSEFVITAGWPDLTWRWDELANDTWVSTNYQYAITGDYNDWNLEPRVQFVDGDGDGLIIETSHNSGLVSTNTAPVVENDTADIYVEQNTTYATVDLYNVFEDTETVDADLSFAVNSSNPSLVSYSLTGGTLTLSFAANSSGTSLITVTASDDHSANPLSVSRVFTVGVKAPITDRTNWYIDAGNGDDAVGNGSQIFPLRSLSALLGINTANPGYVGTGDTVYLAAGNYGTSSDVIAIDGLSLEGTQDVNGESLTRINNLEITADNVTVKNLDFNNTRLELKNVSETLVTNNLFTGSVGISLSLLGSSDNTISHNRFESAQYHSVMLSWDAATGTASNDNQFIRNYFTHRTSAATNESIYCAYSVGNNDSINARNRFIGCAFEETVSGNLIRVITDEGTWWMTDTAAHPYQYSVRFEDCYFKRADRTAAFSEFVITAGWPDLTWRWDELANDTWVSTNYQYAITGDYNDWNLEPRVQFVDGDGNGNNVETSHTAGLYMDTDGDGLDDTLEVNVHGTDPFDSDTDGDGIEDGDEINYGLNPLINDLMFDLDGDGYPNIYEVLNSSDPGDNQSIPAATQTVAADGSSEHSTLQSAINAVTSDYSIVLVKAGAYTGSGNTDFSIYSSDPAMLVISETGAATTVLDGEGVHRGGLIYNARSAMVGFTIQNCTTGGMYIIGNEVLVSKCKIHNNVSQIGGGVYTRGNETYIQGCEIYQNTADQGAGLYAYNVSGLKVYNTLIYNNESVRGGGLYIGSSVDVSLTNTTLFNNNALIYYGNEIHLVGVAADEISLTNSIVWNDATSTSVVVGGSVNASYSIIKGTSGYINDGTVINADPRLTPQALLSAASDGIATNQGTDTGLYFDIHGEIRPDGSGYDIGADEFTDSDADGLPDWLEALGATDPSGDTDGDGLLNLYEYEEGFDAVNSDIDGDNLLDGDELNLYNSDPFDPDTDDDKMFDGEEILNGLNPLANDAMDDLDGDGYPNIYEVRNGSDTQNTNPQVPDIPTPTLTVDTSGSTPYLTLQSGIDAITSDYSIILTKAGEYKGSGNANFIINSNDPSMLVISAGDAENTILDGEGTRRGGQIANSFSGLVGFAVKNCTEAPRGGGLYITGDETFVANCDINNNSAVINYGVSQGGGIYTTAVNTRIKDCSIHNNHAGQGGGLFIGSFATGFKLQNSLIYQNDSAHNGGGIYVTGNTVSLLDCSIYENNAFSGSGGGISIHGNEVHVKSCEIYHNRANNGGGIFVTNNKVGFKAQNTLVYQNESEFNGGGVYLSIGVVDALLVHTTVFNNRASNSQEIYNNGQAELINSIVWNNSDNTNVFAGANVSASYSIIKGTSGYVDNGFVSNSDPLLSPRGFLTAASTGVTINQGTYAGVDVDIHGEPRPEGGGYDIGADEFKDGDFDGLPDWLEALGITDPSGDEDGDLLDNLYEFENFLNVFDPDTDGDGFSDGQEVLIIGSNPLVADSGAIDVDFNSDGINDRIGFLLGIDNTQSDNDGDSLTNEQELLLGTNPNSADTDGDGVDDGIDEFPLDPYLTSRPADVSDTSSPVITLLTPSYATAL